MVSKKKNRSKFAQFLTNLINSFYTREQWSFLLGISKPAISQWCTDKTVPSAENLRYLIGYLADNNAGDLWQEWEVIKYMPLKEITPNFAKIKGANTLNDYLLKSNFDRLFFELNHVQAEMKEHVVDALSAMVYQLRLTKFTKEQSVSLLNELSATCRNIKQVLERSEEDNGLIFKEIIAMLQNCTTSIENVHDKELTKKEVVAKAPLPDSMPKILTLNTAYESKKKWNYDVSAYQMLLVLPLSGKLSIYGKTLTKPYHTQEKKICIIHNGYGDKKMKQLDFEASKFEGYLIRYPYDDKQTKTQKISSSDWKVVLQHEFHKQQKKKLQQFTNETTGSNIVAEPVKPYGFWATFDFSLFLVEEPDVIELY